MCLFNPLYDTAAYFFTLSRFLLAPIWIFVINLLWWLLPQATSESHPFIFGSATCLSQLHHFRSSAVPTVAKAFHSLKNILLLSIQWIFVQTLNRKVFIQVGQLEMIYYLVI